MSLRNQPTEEEMMEAKRRWLSMCPLCHAQLVANPLCSEFVCCTNCSLQATLADIRGYRK